MEPTLKLLDQTKPAAKRLINQKPFLEKLGLLNNDFPIVLVGGTNGKGSTASLLSQICMDAGLTVGLNSSPHLQHYNERICINREPISDAVLQETIEHIDRDFEGKTLNYPEYAFLCALYACRKQHVDIGIFEIGLGGKQDPANTLPADISIITNIDLDHTAILGNTIEEIAAEKAGIIKHNKPLVCGQTPCPKAIEQQAQAQQSTHYQINRDFSFDTFKNQLDLPEPSIIESNAACAIQAAILLKDILPIKLDLLKQTLKTFTLMGRQQTINWICPIILDVAHNPASCIALSKRLNKDHCSGKTIAIFNVSPSKDITKMIHIMSPHIDDWHIPNIKDLSSPHELAAQIPGAVVAQSTNMLLNTLKNSINQDDRIIIFGSFYLVGEALCILSESSSY